MTREEVVAELIERLGQDNVVGGSRKVGEYASAMNRNVPAAKSIHRHVQKHPHKYTTSLGTIVARSERGTKSVSVRPHYNASKDKKAYSIPKRVHEEHPIDKWAKAKNKVLNRTVGDAKRKSTWAAKGLGGTSVNVAAQVGNDTLWQRMVHEAVTSRATLRDRVPYSSPARSTELGKKMADSATKRKAVAYLKQRRAQTNRRPKKDKPLYSVAEAWVARPKTKKVSRPKRKTRVKWTSLPRKKYKEEVMEANWMKDAVKRPGAFRAKAKKAGMSTAAFSARVSKNSGSYDPRTVRQANLAKTFAKFRK